MEYTPKYNYSDSKLPHAVTFYIFANHLHTTADIIRSSANDPVHPLAD